MGEGKMKIVKKSEREMWQTETAKGFEYPFGATNIDCAVVEVNGRHPVSGWYRNTKVDEMVFVKNGSLTICFKEKPPVKLTENDAVFIGKNEWHYWAENSKGTYVAMCNPAWSKIQSENKKTISTEM